MRIDMKHINQLLQSVTGDLFNRTKAERHEASSIARQREMKKICAMLNMDPITKKPKTEDAA